MAMEKPLDPLQISDIQNRLESPDQPAMVVEIENPDSVSIETEDGGLIIDFDAASEMEDVPFDGNLAEYMDDRVLDTLGSELVSAYEDDISSRAMARSLWCTPSIVSRVCN